MRTSGDTSTRVLRPRFWARAARASRLAVHLARGAITVAVVFPFLGPRSRMRRVQKWSRRLLLVLGVRLRVRGKLPGRRAALIVANHVSWIDIFLINAVRPSRFVGKSEIRSWPIIGWLAAAAGTLFIQRGKRRDAGRVSVQVAECLAAGERFAVFPEGNTTAGDRVQSFHASLIQPAIAAGVPVYPAAIRFLRPDGSICREAAYDGDRTIGDVLRETSAFCVIRAEVRFAEPIPTAGRDRRSLARDAQTVIAALLDLPVPGSAPGSHAGPPAAVH